MVNSAISVGSAGSGGTGQNGGGGGGGGDGGRGGNEGTSGGWNTTGGAGGTGTGSNGGSWGTGTCGNGCNGGEVGPGGGGGGGGGGGRGGNGQGGPAGYAIQVQGAGSGAVNWTGTSVPVFTANVTANYGVGCTNSEIVLTKSGAGNWGTIDGVTYTASSSWGAGHEADKAPLNHNTAASNWSVAVNDLNQWLRIDLGSPQTITSFATQGRYNFDQWVTQYIAEYSNDGVSWTNVGTFAGNSDRNTIVRYTTGMPVTARYFRFRPTAYFGHMTMRAEVEYLRYVNNVSANYTSYGTSSSPLSIYYTSTGSKPIMVGSQRYEDLVNIRINRPLPVMTVTPDSTCLGSPFNLSATSAYTVNAWSWEIIKVSGSYSESSPSTPVYTSSAQNPGAVTLSDTGTFQVRLRVRENCCGWSIPVYKTIKVKHIPAAPTYSTGPLTVCAGSGSQSYSVVTSGSAYGVGATYVWSIVGAASYSGTGNTRGIDWGSPGVVSTGTYSVYVVENACTSATFTQNVTIYPIPTVTITPSATTICYGDPVTLTATPNYTHASMEFEFTVNGVSQGWGVSNPLTVNLPYELVNVPVSVRARIATESGTCMGPANSQNVFVQAKPGLLTLTSSNINPCDNTPVTFTAGGAYNVIGMFPEYLFFKNDNPNNYFGIGWDTPNTISLVPGVDFVDGDVINAQVRSTSGSPMCVSNPLRIKVSVGSPLTASLTNQNNQCNSGNTGQLNLSVNGGAPAYYVLWSDGVNNFANGYRKPITVTSAGAVANYAVQVDVAFVANKMNGDYSNIRFTAADGYTQLSYWIESYTVSSARVWVKIPSLTVGNNTIYLYYGNPILTSKSNGYNTFTYFEDFDDFNDWKAYGNGASLSRPSSGVVQLNNPQNACRVWAVPNASIPTLANAEMQMNYRSTGSGLTDYYSGFMCRVTANPSPGAIRGYQFGLRNNALNLYAGRMNLMQDNCTNLTGIGTGTGGINASFVTGKLRFTGANLTWQPDYINNPLSTLAVVDANYVTGNIGIFTSLSAADLQVDWIFARPYLASDPAVVVGGEQAASATILNRTGVAPSTYSAVVYDMNGCQVTTPSTTITAPTALSTSGTVTQNVACYNGTDGAYNYSISGGTAPYHITLAPPSGPNVTAHYNGYRKPVTFNSTISSTNHQVMVTVAFVTGKMKADFSDLRFTAADGFTQLSYWREKFSAGVSAVFWVKVPSVSVGSNTIYAYYGNSALTDKSNGDAVFEFFDDFNTAGINFNKWSVGQIAPTTNTAWSVSGGSLRGGHQFKYLQSNTAFTGNYIAETRIYETTPAPNGFTSIGFYASTSDGAAILTHNGVTYYRNDNGWGGAYAFNAIGQWVRDRITVSPGANMSIAQRTGEVSGSLSQSFTNSGLNAENLRLGTRNDDYLSYDQSFNAQWDFIFVRKYPDMTTAVGAEQAPVGSLSATGLSAGTHTITIVDVNGCSSSTSVTITQPAGPAPVWTGAVSTDWFDTGNWSTCLLPTCSDSVTIPTGAPRYPVVTNASRAYSQDLVIQGSASVTLATNSNFYICGDMLVNNGSGVLSTQANSSITWMGSTNQIYDVPNGTLLRNVIVLQTVPSYIILKSDMVIEESLTLTDGIIDGYTNNKLTRVNNSTPTCVNTGDLNSYVSGLLRRKLSATGSFNFPVGNASKGYQRINFNFTSPTTIDYLVAGFSAYVLLPSPINVSDCGALFDCAPLDNGKWTVNAYNSGGIQISGDGVYSATLYSLGATNSSCGIAYTVVKSPTGMGAWALNGTCVIPSSNPTLVTRTGMSGFSDFGVSQSTQPLPVDLLTFTAVPNNTSIRLNWETAREQNNKGFDIERSTDAGNNFTKIGFVQGKGNTTATSEYTLLDRDVKFDTRYYYRLKQIDNDGSFRYSNVVDAILLGSAANSVVMYPNPTNGLLNIDFTSTIEDIAEIKLVNMLGQEIITRKTEVKKGLTTFELDMHEVSVGTYTIIITTSTKTYTEKIVKSR
ncbi:MAG: DUF2341 domain-containing protein [Bacteroidia bacterium]|nr:DUF2341 domain-containing protein [Bacteroidia bacterium]